MICGSWQAGTIERTLKGTGTPNRRNDIKRTTNGFSHYVHGGLPHPSTVESWCVAIRGMHADAEAGTDAVELLEHWYHNPLSELLCQPSASHDHVLYQLEQLPDGPARALVWQEGLLTFNWNRSRHEIPDSEENINALVKLADYPALLALVGKMRLRQLQGTSWTLDSHYELAIWTILPWVIGSCPNLLLASDAIIDAMYAFMEWAPYTEVRAIRWLYTEHKDWTPPTRSELRRGIELAAARARLNGVNLPPPDLLVRPNTNKAPKDMAAPDVNGATLAGRCKLEKSRTY